MQIIKTPLKNIFKASSLALGMFDGVHSAHKKVIKTAMDKGKEFNCPTCIVTFDTHPEVITSENKIKLITATEEKLELLEKEGVDAVFLIDFDDKFSKISAEKYLKEYLIASLNAKSITIGYDHNFGANKKGNYEFLKNNSIEYNYEVNVVSPVLINEIAVSSSSIRDFLAVGDITSASEYLGRPYSLKGTVIKGMQRGRELGFPTANIQKPEYIAMPANGVYYVQAKIKNELFNAVINIGKRPTFADITYNLIEVHILDFNQNIYNEEIELIFQKKIRDEVKFNSIEELKKQIKFDVSTVYHYIEEYQSSG
ncbi:MAG: bifunctional riboflavin kinase/FAD synthetase [bacterium]